MDISTLNRTTVYNDPNLLSSTTADGAAQGKVAAEAKKSAAAPLLLGSNVLVSYGITDVEALVAQLKNENADTRLSLKLKSLGSLAEGLSTQHLKALEKALALADSVKQLENAQNELSQQSAKAKADLSVLQLEIEALEKQVENARESEKDYNKAVQKQKERKAEAQAKLAALEKQGEKADAEAVAAAKAALSDAEAQLKTAEDALAATSAKRAAAEASLAGKREQATTLQGEIDATAAQTAKNKNEIASLNAQVSALVSSIDQNTLKTIAKEIAATDVEEAESPHDAKKEEEKLEATDVVRILSDALDAVAKDILDEVAEKRIENV